VAWNLRAFSGKNRLEAEMLVYLDDYRKAKAQTPPSYGRYDEDLLCGNWNPAVRVVARSSYQTARELSPELPEDFRNVDMQAFMSRVYALATQI
jgi:hypothetical protein